MNCHQWRVRWRGDEDTKPAETWERWGVLDTATLRERAEALREEANPHCL